MRCRFSPWNRFISVCRDSYFILLFYSYISVVRSSRFNSKLTAMFCLSIARKMDIHAHTFTRIHSKNNRCVAEFPYGSNTLKHCSKLVSDVIFSSILWMLKHIHKYYVASLCYLNKGPSWILRICEKSVCVVCVSVCACRPMWCKFWTSSERVNTIQSRVDHFDASILLWEKNSIYWFALLSASFVSFISRHWFQFSWPHNWPIIFICKNVFVHARMKFDIQQAAPPIQCRKRRGDAEPWLKHVSVGSLHFVFFFCCCAWPNTNDTDFGTVHQQLLVSNVLAKLCQMFSRF